MRFRVKVEWQQEDGTVATAELGDWISGGCTRQPIRTTTDR
jgi:hypothetical protein